MNLLCVVASASGNTSSSFVRYAPILFMKTSGETPQHPISVECTIRGGGFTEVLRIVWNQHANFFLFPFYSLVLRKVKVTAVKTREGSW